MYGRVWNTTDPAEVEAFMYARGGYYDVGGTKIGLGPVHHFRELIKHLAPWFDFNSYSELIINEWPLHDTVAILGPAASGKTYTAAMCAYAEFFAHPKGTSILCSSITLSGLRLRVWGALTEILHKVKALRPTAPGYIVESEFKIFAAQPSEDEIKVSKDAIIGLACKLGDNWVGIGSYVGLHNERLIGIFDEASLMPRSFWDATANLRKSPVTKFVALGNPKDPMDALGVIAEPAKELGGWDGFVQPRKTCTWKAVGSNSVTIQLYGPDGPNFGPDGVKYPYLITPKQLEEDKLRFGEDSWQFQMMNMGIMPKGVGSRRVITKPLCERGNAFGEVVWDGSGDLIDVVGLDPALSMEDGDRTVLIRLTIGTDVYGYRIAAVTDGPILVPLVSGKVDETGKPMTAEDQIGYFVRDYAVANNIKPSRFGFDATGHGSVGVAIARAWSPNIHAIDFGGRPPDRPAAGDPERSERDLYGKMVTSLWFAARHAITCGQIRQLPISVFEEGALREYFVTKDGKQDVEKKIDTRRRMGRSPDLFDAFVIALEVARRNGFEIGAQHPSKRSIDRVEWLEKTQRAFLEAARAHELVPA